MFLENYRRDDSQGLFGGGDAVSIPYPPLTSEDWKIWRAYLPVKQEEFTGESARTLMLGSTGENSAYGIPEGVVEEINRAGKVFPKIEVWRKRHIDKDPIAVGLIGDQRYLIARWGEASELVPFNAIKRRVSLIKFGRFAFPSTLLLVLWLCYHLLMF